MSILVIIERLILINFQLKLNNLIKIKYKNDEDKKEKLYRAWKKAVTRAMAWEEE